ncbi:MAG: FG-GAP repeat domain-containing protein [Desulfovibrionaceae bacterium]
MLRFVRPGRPVLSALPVLLALLLALPAAFPAPAQAQAYKKFIVLPYAYHGPDAYQHYGKAVRAEMARRLRMVGKFEPMDQYTIDGREPAAPATPAQTVAILERLGGDYLVWGDVTVKDGQAALYTKVMDGLGNAVERTATVPLDQMVMQIQSTAQSIDAELFPEAAAPAAAKVQSGVPVNPDILDAQSGTTAAVTNINPQFRYEGGTQTQGRWQSAGFRWACRSFAVCDGDGDGKNEVFVLGDDFSIHVLRFEQGRLVEAGVQPLNTRGEHLKLRAYDYNRDGVSELVLSSYRDDKPDGTIYSYQGGHFTVLAENIRKFLNVIALPPTYAPTLVGQRKGDRTLLQSDDLYELAFNGHDITEVRRLVTPEYANVFALAYLPEPDGNYKVVVNDTFSRMRVYNQQNEPLYQSEETYCSSGVALQLPQVLAPGLGESTRNIGNEDYYYIPLPMIPIDFSGSGKHELLVNKDISVSMQLFYRYRTFTQGELHSLFWDGTGLNLAWKTRRIKGTVSDFCLADLNSDGHQQLVVLLNTYPGALGLEYRKTIIVAYDLNVPQQ